MPYIVGIIIFVTIIYQIFFAWAPLITVYGHVNLIGEKDYSDAVYWFKKAAHQGYAPAQNSLAELYEEGVAFDGYKDYSIAAMYYKRAADQDYIPAQAHLGHLYQEGHGVKRDYAKAYDYYTKSINQSDDWKLFAFNQPYTAENGMGELNRYGLGIMKNYREAIKWFQKASDKDDPAGKNNLGEMYLYGLGTEQDYSEAVDYFEDASDQNFARSQYNMGLMYQKGYGVDHDAIQAFQWFEKASEQGMAKAQYNAGAMTMDGSGTKKSIPLAKKWLQKAAYQEHVKAQYDLSTLLMNEKNYPQSAYWAKKAALHNNEKAQYRLGMLYQYGLGVKKDTSTAFNWYFKSSKNGYAPAYRSVGKILLDKHENKQAFSYYLQAAEKKSIPAYMDVGSMYYTGNGVDQNYEKAAKWYQKAADQKNPNAQNLLGEMYADGKGLHRDYPKAMILFSEASKQKHPFAMFNIGRLYHNGWGVRQNYRQAAVLFDNAKKTATSSTTSTRADLLERISFVERSRWKNLPINGLKIDGILASDINPHIAKFTGKLDTGVFSESNPADNEAFQERCIDTKPKEQKRVAKEKFIISDHIRGLYNLGWGGNLSGHFIFFDKVRVFANGDLPMENPNISIFRDYYNGLPNETPDMVLKTTVNTYKGEKGLLYRVFIRSNDTLRCGDIVIPYKGIMESSSAKFYYVQDSRIYVKDFKLKAIH